MKKTTMPLIPKQTIYRIGASSLIVLSITTGSQVSARDSNETEEESQTAKLAPDPTTLEPKIEDGKQIYEAAAFARFAPQTASDMVRQIPGFTVSQADEGRGLGEASQNVLINNQRISGKSNDANTVLGRTPASSVVRIEIVDGATLDIPGLSGQVLNLVTNNTGLSGSYTWRPLFRTRGLSHHFYNGQASISGKLGKGNFTLGLSNRDNSFRGGVNGGDISTDANGILTNSRERRARFSGDRPELSGSYTSTSAAGSIFNANAELSYNRFRGRNDFIRTEANGDIIIEAGRNRSNRPGFEISSDYEFGLAGGRLKFIGLQRLGRSRFSNLFRRDFQNGDLPESTLFARQSVTGESVGRIEYRWKGGKADWQLSAEGAYNFLDADSDLEVLENGILDIDPPENAKVTEKRGEVILSYGRPIAKNLTFQGSLGGEYSILEQTIDGGNGQRRSFLRPKGSVSLAWKASPRFDVSARVSREVGQLNFGDFLSSVDVQNDNNNAGNANLVPPQSWLGRLEFNRSLGAAGSVKLQIEGELISDIVDQIPISDTEEAIGNLPSARRASAELTASFLLDQFGWKGAKLDVGGFYQTSSLRDPLTGANRRINANRIFSIELDFRHDIPGSNWAWGASLEDRGRSGFFRLNFQNQEQDNGPRTRLFLEHKDVFGLKIRATAGNLTGGGFNAQQIFFVDRRTGPVDFFRNAQGEGGPVLRFDISGTF